MPTNKPPTEFPPLLSDEEIDARTVRTPPAAAPRVNPLPLIEARYPRIVARIRALWGTPACDAYLDQLLIDERGNRQGFPPEIVAALLEVSGEHQRRFGYRNGGTEDWTDGSRRGGR